MDIFRNVIIHIMEFLYETVIGYDLEKSSQISYNIRKGYKTFNK